MTFRNWNAQRLTTRRLLSVFCACVFALVFYPASAQQIHPNRASAITVDNADSVMLMAYRQLPDATEVYWSPGNQRLAVVSGRQVEIYQTNDLNAQPQIITHDAMITDIAWNPDGRILAVASRDEWLRLWSVPGGAIQQQTRLNVRDIDYSPDGSVIAFVDFDDDSVNVYNVLEDRVVLLDQPEGISLPPTGVAFNYVGDLLVQGTPRGDVFVWQVRSGEILYERENPNISSGGSSVSVYPNDGTDFMPTPTGILVAVADITPDRRLSVWEAAGFSNTEPRWQYAEGLADAIRTFVNVRFSPNGEVLAVAGGFYEGETDKVDSIVLFSASTGNVLNELPHPGVTSLAFSADGRQIVSVGGGEMRLWRLEADLFTVEELLGFSDKTVDAFCTPGTAQPLVGRNETVSIGWSWYAREREQLQTHINNAIYSINLDGEPLTGWVFISTPRREVQNFDDYTVYYYLLADRVLPGEHVIGYEVTWRAAIEDGYDAYGPGTARPMDQGQCIFQVDVR